MLNITNSRINTENFNPNDFTNSITFHHTDLDGIGAGQVLYLCGCQEFVPCKYSVNEPKNHLDKCTRKDVYVVDFGFNKLGDFEALFNANPARIIWYDHHITSFNMIKGIINIPKYKEWIDNGRLIVDININKSGALITLENLINDFANHPLYEAYIYIDDHDRWVHKYDSTYLNQYAIDANNLYINSPMFKALAYDKDGEVLRYYLEVGKKFHELQKQKNALINEYFGRNITFEGYSTRVIEGRGNSELFGEDFKIFHLCMIIFHKDNENYSFTLFSSKPDIDCSAICKKYHGGGHKSAAGGIITVEELKSFGYEF